MRVASVVASIGVLLALMAGSASAEGIGGLWHDGNPRPTDAGESFITGVQVQNYRPSWATPPPDMLAALRIHYDPLGLARFVDVTADDVLEDWMAPWTPIGPYGIPEEGVTEWVYPLASNSRTTVPIRIDVPEFMTPEIAEYWGENVGRVGTGLYVIELRVGYVPVEQTSSGGIQIVTGANWIIGFQIQPPAVAPVPEPASFVTMAFGLAGIWYYRRRRSR